MHVPPQEYAPSLFHGPLTTPLPFKGFSNRLDQEFSKLCSWYWTPSRRNHFPTNSLTWREFLIGMTTLFFNHGPENLPLKSTTTKNWVRQVDDSTIYRGSQRHK
jgi:hypothetical protein